jgi:hypothetical protein
VTAVLYHQAASKEYIDFLRRFGGVDGDTLGVLWDSSRSDPVVVTRAWTPAYPLLFPVIAR